MPIDVVDESVIVKANIGWYHDPKTGALVYGVPPTSPIDYSPLNGGRDIRGLGASPTLSGKPIQLDFTPYNQVPTLLRSRVILTVEAGQQTTVEVQTGALRVAHDLAGYKSVGQDRGVSLYYDSTRAEAQPIYYFSISNLLAGGANAPVISANTRLIVRLSARMEDKVFYANGLSVDDATILGLSGGENFFKLPGNMISTESYGAALQIDLSKAKSGLYTFSLDYGLFTLQNGKYTGGRFVTATQPVAVINSKDGMFGAGWGVGGFFEIFTGDSGVVLVDGNGNEQIYLAPQIKGQPFTSLSTADYSTLVQMGNGTFERRMITGTLYDFDANGKLSLVTDRNGNKTQYITAGDKLMKIIDPVLLETVFDYNGDQVSSVTDPAMRVTTFTYDGQGNLASITDPDKSQQTFLYQNVSLPQLMTSLVQKRGNAGKSEPLQPSEFLELYRYDEFGRIMGGTRVDAKNFALKPAQTFALFDPANRRPGQRRPP